MDSIKDAFDSIAHDYDRARRQLVPCFDEFYRAAIDLLPFEKELEFEVLDLGAGYSFGTDCILIPASAHHADRFLRRDAGRSEAAACTRRESVPFRSPRPGATYRGTLRRDSHGAFDSSLE